MVLLKKIHKWASVIIGLQFLLWLLSGLYFNLMDHKEAKGHTYQNHSNLKIKVNNEQLVDFKEVLEKFNPSVLLEITHLLEKPYYLLTHKKGLYRSFENHYTLVDAYTGEEVIIDRAYAEKLAKYSYIGPGKISAIKLSQPPLDGFPKYKNASWQIDFSDDINTSVYVEAGSGQIVGHSDDHKRLADIFFMLHFMDYASEGSFNNIQIILFAFITLWLSLTGLIWTIELGINGQFKVKFFTKNQGVKLSDKHQKNLGIKLLPNDKSLLDGLIEHQITLPSTCGGSGTCGRCKVMITPILKATSTDQVHLTIDEIQQGYRLACQHASHDVTHITLIDVIDTYTNLK